MWIKTGDTVVVIAGADRGARGKVLAVDRKQHKVIVEGVGRVYKHVRRSQKHPQGGRLSKEMPVDISNVMLIDPKSDQPTKIGVRYLPDGSKERFSKQSGASLDVLTPAKPARAKQ